MLVDYDFERLAGTAGYVYWLPLLKYLAFILVTALLLRFVLGAIQGVLKNNLGGRENALSFIVDGGFFKRASFVIQAFVAYLQVKFWLVGEYADIGNVAELFARIIIVIFLVLAIYALLTVLEECGRRRESLKGLPLKGAVQSLKIICFIVAALLIISWLIGKSPTLLLSSLGAMSAVVMLVFKDPIMGFVAGVQLSANSMLSIGDWVEVPSYGADGEVVEVTLTTVKISNWDHTISTVPAYALISGSFKNWKNMQLSGGRRIKRAVLIDSASVRFLGDDDIRNLAELDKLSGYLKEKVDALSEANKSHQALSINHRRLTNIGTFRAYLRAYLKSHPDVHGGYIAMVRQLEPTEKGIPLEVYCFTNKIAWEVYEDIQSDIFDHIYSILPYFDLRVAQLPMGSDARLLAEAIGLRCRDELKV